jgi:hypothetical protein
MSDLNMLPRFQSVDADFTDVPVQIYVGESPHAAKLDVTADRLEDGDYRIASGEKWLALIGEDTGFTPKEPCAKNNSGRGAKLQGEWGKASGLPFGVRNGELGITPANMLEL